MFSRFTIFAIVLFALTAPVMALRSADSMAVTVSEPWFGDYLEMKQEKVVRVLIPYSLTSYYLDKGKEKGITVEYMREFERFLNRGVKRELDKVRLVLIPTSRDRLIDAIAEGRGDIAAANLTITPERLEKVDFSSPVLTGVREVVLTRKGAPAIKSLSDLSGMTIHVRASSSYFASLQRVQGELERQKLKPLEIKKTDELLEDEDLIEMVHTGILPAIVMDEHKAKLWLKLFDRVTMHKGYPIREGGEIACLGIQEEQSATEDCDRQVSGRGEGGHDPGEHSLQALLFRRQSHDKSGPESIRQTSERVDWPI